MHFIRRVILACAIPAALAAQTDPHEVQPERPTVATHAGTVAPGWLEIESGFEHDRYSSAVNGAVSPTVFKIGLAERAQLSVFAPILTAPGTSASFGVGDLSVGVKWRLADELPVLGRFAVLPAIKMPTGSTTSGHGTGTTDVGLLLISSHDIGPVSLDINAGYTRRGGDGTATPRNATLWTVSSGGPAIGPVGWVAEVYGYPQTTGPAGQASIVALLGGPTLSVYKWLALDAGLIAPITGPQPHAVYFGAVWNVGRIIR